MNRILPNFIYALILTRSRLELLLIIFRAFVPVLWPIIYAKISFPFNILRTNGRNSTKFYIWIRIDKIYVRNVTHHFPHLCTREMAVHLSQYFVSVQYLENKDKIYVGIVNCHFFERGLWPLIDVRITLPLNILRNSGLLLHVKHCSGAIVRYSDNSSLCFDNSRIYRKDLASKIKSHSPPSGYSPFKGMVLLLMIH